MNGQTNGHNSFTFFYEITGSLNKVAFEYGKEIIMSDFNWRKCLRNWKW